MCIGVVLRRLSVAACLSLRVLLRHLILSRPIIADRTVAIRSVVGLANVQLHTRRVKETKPKPRVPLLLVPFVDMAGISPVIFALR